MRKIKDIAHEIQLDWTNVYFGASPYLEAMHSLNKVTDNYGQDGADSIVLYFLSNAMSWKGDNARRIKTELKNMLKRG